MLLNDDAWINEFAWARDSKSIYFEPNDGTFASHEHMFEQPIVRVWLDGGRSERVVPGETVDYSLSFSADGRRLAYRAVEGRTMGDVFVLDVASGRSTKITEVNPELHDLALGTLKPVKWKSTDGMDIWALLLTGSNFNISAAVGFISILGVAIMNGLLMVSSFNHSRGQGMPLREAITRGVEKLIRPVTMTALAAIFGLLPAAFATRIGSQSQRPLAILATGFFYYLANLVPVLYSFYGHREPRRDAGGIAH